VQDPFARIIAATSRAARIGPMPGAVSKIRTIMCFLDSRSRSASICFFCCLKNSSCS